MVVKIFVEELAPTTTTGWDATAEVGDELTVSEDEREVTGAEVGVGDAEHTVLAGTMAVL